MSELIVSVFGRWVEQQRKSLGLTQVQLAEKLRTDGFKLWHPAVSRIERGERDLRVSEAQAIARALGGRITFDVAECACEGKPPAGFTCNECGRSA